MTLTYFTARSILETLAFTSEKVKTMDFLFAITAAGVVPCGGPISEISENYYQFRFIF